MSVCVSVSGCVPQDILPLDYALKLLFMFMEIVFRPAYVLTVPPLPAPCQSLSLSLFSLAFVPHYRWALLAGLSPFCALNCWLWLWR